MSKKRPDRERLRERWVDAQELSGGPFRIGSINRHRQFALLHAAAKARVTGNVELARGVLSMSKAARTEQPVNRTSPMELIERRYTGSKEGGENAALRNILAGMIDPPTRGEPKASG
jgi:hypothetical protein